MKKTLVIIALFLASLISSSAWAAGQPKYFEFLSQNPVFDYTYISPAMLNVMGDCVVNNDMQIKASDISSIETVSTLSDGTNADFWKAIRSLKQNKKLETLSTKKQGNYRYDVLARTSGDGKTITNLMVITQNTGACVTVVYIEGKLPLSDISINF